MKKSLLFLYFLIACIPITSCSQDDAVFESAISGVWELSAWNVDTPIDLNNDGVSSTNLLKEFGCLAGSELIFKDAVNATIFYSSEVAFNVEIQNESQFFMFICGTNSNSVPRQITYVHQENSVILNDRGEELVLNLSQNTLSMLVPNGFVARDVNSQAVVISQDIIYVFTRQ